MSLPLAPECDPLQKQQEWPFINTRTPTAGRLFAPLWFLYMRVTFKQRRVHSTCVGGGGWDRRCEEGENGWWEERRREGAEAEVPHRRLMTWRLKGSSQWFSTQGWRFSRSSKWINLRTTRDCRSWDLGLWRSPRNPFSWVVVLIHGSQFKYFIGTIMLWLVLNLLQHKCDNTRLRLEREDHFFYFWEWIKSEVVMNWCEVTFQFLSFISFPSSSWTRSKPLN